MGDPRAMASRASLARAGPLAIAGAPACALGGGFDRGLIQVNERGASADYVSLP
jgi:hypothetical protein